MMTTPELSLDDLNGGFLGVEYLILDVDYAMTLNVDYDGQPDDTQVSLVTGPRRFESQMIDACLAEHRDELSIRRLQCTRCGHIGTDRRESVCKNCRSPLEVIRDTSDEWLRSEAWRRLQWEVSGFQSRSIVPKWLVEELYPNNTDKPPDIVLPLSLVFNRLLESMRHTKEHYIRECWNHLCLGKSVSEMLPRGENIQGKFRCYNATREKLIAGYNWLTGLAHQYPEFKDGWEEHRGIRRFPPAVTVEAVISGTPPTAKPGKGKGNGVTIADPQISKLEDSTPPLDRDSGEWVKNKRAAQIEGVETRTLADYRLQGIKNAAGTLGRDKDGRVWRREGTPGAHPWYLRSTLLAASK